MLLTVCLESKLGFARSHLVLSLLSLPCRTAVFYRNVGKLAPQSAPMILQGLSHHHGLHGNGPVLPVGSSRFSHKAGAPAFPPANWARREIPTGCSEKGVHPSVNDCVSNYNSYNLLDLATKECLEICSSLQNVNTLLLKLILNIQFTDCDLIIYINHTT